MKMFVFFMVSLFFSTLIQAQSVYDINGHYLGQASQTRGYSPSEMLEQQQIQDQARYSQAMNQTGYEGQTQNYSNRENGQNFYGQNQARQIRLIQAPVVGIRVHQQIENYNTPTTQCQTYNVVQRQNGSTPGTLLGSIIGGVLGHQIGHGRGRTAATIGGAVIGGGIGYNASAQNVVTPVQRCYQTEQTQQVALPIYEVSYRYQGQIRTTQMDHNPGRYVQIQQSANVID